MGGLGATPAQPLWAFGLVRVERLLSSPLSLLVLCPGWEKAHSYLTFIRQAAIYNILTHTSPKQWAHISMIIMIIMTHSGKTE